MEKNDLIDSFEITNGYVFRQIFELYYKLIINVIPIYLKENGFILIQTLSPGFGFCLELFFFVFSKNSFLEILVTSLVSLLTL